MRSGDLRHIYPAWFPEVYGYSVSGIIDAVGAGVTSRSIGDAVYGINNPIMRHGYAQYLCGPESNVYPKPPSMDFAPRSRHRGALRRPGLHGPRTPIIAEIMPEMTRRLTSGELALPEIANTFSLAQAAHAHEAFERSAPRGRLVLLS